MIRSLKTLLALLLAAPLAAHPIDPDPRAPLVQVALLLDTSNSMDGLIHQAKSQLWRIVNDLADGRRHGRAPRIEVALYEYGNAHLAAGENYLRQVLPLTANLDHVSEKLFALTTHGGEEYCGAVIKDAVKNLAWDPRSSTYKAVFVAGNEPFTQGGVDFRDAVGKAVSRDIVVNTIFCGPRAEGIATAWKTGADHGRGAFLTINQDDAAVVARTPFDDEIERLGRALNDTYVAYGDLGRAASGRRERADALAGSAAPQAAPVERSLFKAKAQYEAEGDAVAGVAAGKMSAAELKKDELPAEYRALSDEKLEGALKAKADERAKIQRELDRLGKARAAHLARQAPAGGETLDQAVRAAVRAQAGAKEFRFEN